MNAIKPEELLAEILAATHGERMPFETAMGVLGSALIARAAMGGLSLGDIVKGVTHTFLAAKQQQALDAHRRKRATAERLKRTALQ